MKYPVFVLFSVCLFAGRQATAAVTPLQQLSFWHDTTIGISVQPPVQQTGRKTGFLSKIKTTVVSFFAKKVAPKQAADTRKTLGIIALSMLAVGLAVPVLGGPVFFFALVPASLVTGVISLFIKSNPGGEATANGNKKKRTSNTASIAAIIISGGLLAFLFILSLAWGGHR
jgi:hypothetical protein